MQIWDEFAAAGTIGQTTSTCWVPEDTKQNDTNQAKRSCRSNLAKNNYISLRNNFLGDIDIKN